jgi:hypothetical protein
MSEDFAGSAEMENGPSPRQIIQAIVEQGKSSGRGLLSHVEALSFARRHGWRELETEEYARLGVLLVQQRENMDDAFAEALLREVASTDLGDDIHVVLRTLLAGLARVDRTRPSVARFVDTFETRLDTPSASWNARLMLPGYFDRLQTLDARLAETSRRRLTRRMVDWVIEYHVSDVGAGFDLRSRAIFNALLSASWSESREENVTNGLDGALDCALDKLMQAWVTNWFKPFLDELTARLVPMSMFRRVTAETLFRIGESLSAARRAIYDVDPEAALAITAVEDAVHRPHRRQLDRSAVRLDLELPGPRGFGRGLRLRVFDISRDGCLAVTEGPAQFEQTAAPVETSLERGKDRSYPVHRFSGIVRQGSADIAVHPGVEVMLHDASRRREWAAIDGASVVRVTPDTKDNRLWLGFHFDRVVPQVQQEIEALVYGAA